MPVVKQIEAIERIVEKEQGRSSLSAKAESGEPVGRQTKIRKQIAKQAKNIEQGDPEAQARESGVEQNKGVNPVA